MDKEIDYWIKDGDIGYQREVDSCDNCETDLAITIKTYSPGVVCDGCMEESK